MSIIHDALKKVQTNLQNGQSTAQPVDVAAAPAAAKPTVAAKGPLQILLLVLALAVIAGSVWYILTRNASTLPKIQAQISRFRSQAKKAILPAPAPAVVVAAPAAVAPVAPVTTPVAVPVPVAPVPAPVPVAPVAIQSPPDEPVLKIEGIINHNGAMAALVNGKIYEQGDDIEGEKIVKIEEKSITVSKDGNEKTIKIGD